MPTVCLHAVALSLAALSCTAAYTVTIYPQILSQNGRTRFETDRWNSHNGLDIQSFIPKMKDMGTRAGRWLNPDLNGGIFPNAREDPNRRGYADPDYFQDPAVQKKLCSPYMDALAGYGSNRSIVMEIKGQFWPKWMNTSEHGGEFPNNLDAAADMLVLLVDAVYSCTQGIAPEYFEVINEPDSMSPNLKWDTAIQFHKIVAQKLHAKYPFFKVGGPTKDGSISNIDQKDFLLWEPVRDFMNMSLDNLDFFSFHPYNSFNSTGNMHHFNGINEARLVAVIDIVENYAQILKGAPVPLILSEFGLGRRYSDSQTPDSLVQWAYIFLHNAHLFTYLNHRGVIDQAVAFLVNLASDQFADASLFYKNGTATNDEKAFRLWKTLSSTNQFLRVDSSYNQQERMVSPLAVVDVESKEITVLLHNYAQTPNVVNLTFPNSWVRLSAARATCLYLSETKTPVLSMDKPVTITNNVVSLLPESTCFFSMSADTIPTTLPIVNEITAYGTAVAVPITRNVVVNITLPNVTNVVYARLRIAVSNADVTVNTKPNTVYINGYEVNREYTLYDPDRLTGVTQWEVYTYELQPKNILPDRNIVVLNFSQDSGYISSAAIVVGAAEA